MITIVEPHHVQRVTVAEQRLAVTEQRFAVSTSPGATVRVRGSRLPSTFLGRGRERWVEALRPALALRDAA